jgi:hypothetical protein
MNPQETEKRIRKTSLRTRLYVGFEMDWLSQQNPELFIEQEQAQEAREYATRLTETAIRLFKEWEKHGRPE